MCILHATEHSLVRRNKLAFVWGMCRCEGVLVFLAEAAALVARKPGELFELVHSLLSAADGAHAAPGGPHKPGAGRPVPAVEQALVPGLGLGFSLLAVAVGRQALRVAGSGKLAASTRMGIAAYVAGLSILELSRVT